MRYFTIYVTQGGYLKVTSNREEKRAFNWFARLVAPKNPRYEPPIWALCVKVNPSGAVFPGESSAELCKIFGELP